MTAISQLLSLQGAQTGHRTGDKNKARERAKHSRFIADHFKAFDNIRGHLFHPKQHPILLLSSQEMQVAEYLARQNWIIKVSPQAWRISDDDCIRSYLSGAWLEELVFLAHEEAGVDEVYFGQEVEWSVNGVKGKNEIDVIARRGDLLSFTSCKTIRVGKSTGHMEKLREFLTETDYWNIHFAQNKGRALLVTTADFYDELNRQCHRYPQLLARASILDVSLSGLEDLKWEKLLGVVKTHWGGSIDR